MLIKSRIRERLLSVIKKKGIEAKVVRAENHFGDYASNVALEAARLFKKPPLAIAQEIQEKILEAGFSEFAKVEIAGPGFINFTFSSEFLSQSLREILARRDCSQIRFPDLEKTHSEKKILLEYVSANPTGPLHVGHGRWAVIGSVLAQILSLTGAEVYQEFYVNDTGQQIKNLIDSVEAKRAGKTIPEGGYHGEYVQDLAESTGDPVQTILKEQKKVLSSIGVGMDNFYSEKSLYTDGAVEKMLDYLKSHDLAYKQDGAWWFPSTRSGDDKDRVLIRSNGEITYFGVDIAYHYTKYLRGYPYLIDVLGADHHGYVKRIASAVKMISGGKAQVDAVVGQLVSVLRDGKPVRMSKRAGDFISLEEVVEEIGSDVLRYFFSMRSPHVPLEFDLKLAKEKSLENPVFYIQYSHARIASVKKKAHDLGVSSVPLPLEELDFSLIESSNVREIVNKLLEWEEDILSVSNSYEIQHINNYLYDLSTLFHRYYNQETFVSDKSSQEKQLSRHRLLLLEAIDRVLIEGLTILGISSPDKM